MVNDSHVLRGRKLNHMGKDQWRGIAIMQLEVKRKMTPSPCGEGFTRKDSHALEGKKP